MSAFIGDGATPQPALPLGEVLLQRGFLTREQLDAVLEEQAQTGRPLGQIVVARGFVVAPLVAQALATQVGGLTESEYGYATGFAPLPAMAPTPETTVAPEPAERMVEPPPVQPLELLPEPAAAPAAEPLAQLEPAGAPQARDGAAREMDAELSAQAAARAAQDRISAHVAAFGPHLPNGQQQDAAPAEPDAEPEVVEQLRVEAAALETGLAPALQPEVAAADAAEELRAEVVSLEAQLASAAAQLASTTEQVSLLERQLADSVLALTAQADDAAAELDALRRESAGLAEAQQQLVQVTMERDEARRLVADREERLDQFVREREQMAAELTQARDQNPVRRVPDTGRHFVFVPGASGYRLVEGSGPAPAAGATLEFDDRPYLVVRVGRAPLPGEPVACAYAVPA